MKWVVESEYGEDIRNVFDAAIRACEAPFNKVIVRHDDWEITAKSGDDLEKLYVTWLEISSDFKKLSHQKLKERFVKVKK